MRIRSPSSHAHVCVRWSPLDVVVAIAAPVLALYLRNAPALSEDGASVALSYWLLSLLFSLIFFVVFRVHGAIPRYLAITDIVDLAFAVLAAEFLTCVVLFTFTRLDGIPRSVPAIHALILGAGLLAVRTLAYLKDKRQGPGSSTPDGAAEHLILIGLNDLSVLFMKFLEATGGGERKVIALLDEKPQWFGHSVNGVRVFGPPADLAVLIGEFETHGIPVKTVVIGVKLEELSEASLQEIDRVCAERRLELVLVPQFFILNSTNRSETAGRMVAKSAAGTTSVPRIGPTTASVNSTYFRCRRSIDLVVALILSVVLMPVWLTGAVIVFCDVGTPLWFWQQRTGMGGRAFQLYKFRTLRPGFDRNGRKLPEDQRRSRLGGFLRRTRIDELPQLLNVVTGDMALIGPRPLLPQDQPPNPAIRLTVRPGITGWAQVNGGTLLSAAEKDILDSWYIANASLWIDLRIITMTFLSLFRGDRRSDKALSRAQQDTGSPRVQVSTRFAANNGEREIIEPERRAAAGSL